MARAEGQALQYDVHTTEAIVNINNQRYRKIDYKNEVFYLRLLESESNASDLELACGQGNKLKMENQILISTRITKRSSLFIDGLRQTCHEIRAGRSKIDIDPNIRIGFVIDESKKDIIKNKKVYWNPLTNGLGLAGEW